MVIKLLIYLVLTVSGLLLFKRGGSTNSIEITFNYVKFHLSSVSLVGILCYGCSFLLWLNIIKNNELTYIFPIANGLVSILTVVVGVVILHESINTAQFIGITFIIIGVIINNLYK